MVAAKHAAMGAAEGVAAVLGSAFMAAVVALTVMKAVAHTGMPAQLSAPVVYTVMMAVVLLVPGRLSKGYSPFVPVMGLVWRRLVRLHAVCLVLLLAAWAAGQMIRRADAWPEVVRDHHEVVVFVALFGLAWVEFLLAARMLDGAQRSFGRHT